MKKLAKNKRAITSNNSLTFHVGPFEYSAVITDRPIFDLDGNQLEGLAVEHRRLLILSCCVELDRREEVALHELGHAYLFHFPAPRTHEERCQFFAVTARQLRIDLEAQGGAAAFLRLKPKHVPHLSTPLREWIRPEIAAEKLAITVRSVRRLVKAGKLRGIEFPGSETPVLRIERVDFDRFIRSHRVGKKGGAK